MRSISSSLGRAGAEQRAQEEAGLAERGELVGGRLGIVDGELAPGAGGGEEGDQPAPGAGRPDAWNAAPSSGKRPASAMQTRNISWAPGEKRKAAKLRAMRRSASSTGSRPPRAHHLAGAAALALHHRLEELPLVGEVAVERRLGGAGGAGDLVDAGALVAPVHEDLARALEHLGAFRAAPGGASASLTPFSSSGGPLRAGPIGNGTVQFKPRARTIGEKAREEGTSPPPRPSAEAQLVLSLRLDEATSDRVSWPHRRPCIPTLSSSWVQTGALPAPA